MADTNGVIPGRNMNIILSAAGLVMVAFGAFITFQNNATDRRISDVREEISRIEAGYVRKEDLARSEANNLHREDMARLETGYLRKDEHLEFKSRIDRELQRLSEDALRRQASVVPRTEHEARWIATENSLKAATAREAEDFKLFSDRLNEVRGATTGTVTLRDEIKRLQDDIAEMRRHQMRDKP